MIARFQSRFDRFRRSEDGAVAVEFALLAPLLFAMLFGIVCLGYFMALSHSVQGLATSSARASLAGITTAERQTFAEAYLAQAGARYPLLDASAISSSVTMSEGAASAITVTVNYALGGSMLDLATGFLKLDLTSLETGAYLAY
ncbi:TadE/TadG family type IV pilus assembly protein [Marivita sp.]|uniref:TadE/TadG family type IV pilus assembly protein n=1 Tax=Marivita sp. TaxID=2003365 RepID=UPI003F727BD7